MTKRKPSGRKKTADDCEIKWYRLENGRVEHSHRGLARTFSD